MPQVTDKGVEVGFVPDERQISGIKVGGEWLKLLVANHVVDREFILFGTTYSHLLG